MGLGPRGWIAKAMLHVVWRVIECSFDYRYQGAVYLGYKSLLEVLPLSMAAPGNCRLISSAGIISAIVISPVCRGLSSALGAGYNLVTLQGKRHEASKGYVCTIVITATVMNLRAENVPR